MTASALRCASRLDRDHDYRPATAGPAAMGEALADWRERVLIFTRYGELRDPVGEFRHVLVHRFVTRGAIEQTIDRMIAEKRQRADDLPGGGHEIDLTELSDDELIDSVRLDVARANPHTRS